MINLTQLVSHLASLQSPASVEKAVSLSDHPPTAGLEPCIIHSPRTTHGVGRGLEHEIPVTTQEEPTVSLYTRRLGGISHQ